MSCAHVWWCSPRALLRLRVFGWLLLGFPFYSESGGDAYALLQTATAAFLELRRTTTEASLMTELAKELSMDQGELFISGYVSYPVRKRTSRRKKRKKLAQRYPIWRREMKIIRRQRALWLVLHQSST